LTCSLKRSRGTSKLGKILIQKKKKEMKRRREDRNGYDRILSEIAEPTNTMKMKITMMKLKVPLMMLWIHLREAA
jgi:hypothetical protein